MIRPGALGAIALLASALVACRSDGVATVPELAVTAGEDWHAGDSWYAFELPGRVPAGPTRIVLANNGNEPHRAELYRLDERGTGPDFAAALESGDAAAAEDLGSYIGGTGLVEPGELSPREAVVHLEPGEYVFICSEVGPDGNPHHAHGMVRPFVVIE
jgi:hypothetical protein